MVGSGRSAVWLARLVRDQEVAGSNPAVPTIFLAIPDSILVEPHGPAMKLDTLVLQRFDKFSQPMQKRLEPSEYGFF